MKIRFTSVALSSIGSILSKVTVPLEKRINTVFSELSYGADIGLFTAVVIASGSAEQNEKFCKTHNKSGTDKHPMTNEEINFLSFALPFEVNEFEGKSESDICELFCNALEKRLDNPNIRMLKGFDYEQFSSDMKIAIKNQKLGSGNLN